MTTPAEPAGPWTRTEIFFEQRTGSIIHVRPATECDPLVTR